jgi:glycosyltransferase involved in cell wall biosynthesis
VSEQTSSGGVLVSVVLPTYNRRRVLGRAVFSVLGQTYRNLELIVVDDGSTDGTEDFVAAVDDPRVHFVGKQHREGVARARNDGIRMARGELIAFQDSDDEWLATKLERQVALLGSSPPDVGWIGGSHLAMFPGCPRLIASDNLVRGAQYELDLLDGRAFVTPTWLVRRELLFEAGLFRETLDCLEDWDLIFRLDGICRFRAVPEPVLIKYGSDDSLFGDEPRRMAALEAILALHRERWLRSPRRYAHLYGELGRWHCSHGDRPSGVRYLSTSRRVYPWRMRTYAFLAAAAAGPRWCRRLDRLLSRRPRRGSEADPAGLT